MFCRFENEYWGLGTVCERIARQQVKELKEKISAKKDLLVSFHQEDLEAEEQESSDSEYYLTPNEEY